MEGETTVEEKKAAPDLRPFENSSAPEVATKLEGATNLQGEDLGDREGDPDVTTANPEKVAEE